MNGQTFVIERSFRASAERVWQALTDKEQMKQWYFDLDDFRPEPGFTFSFAGKGQKGEHYLHLCEVKEAIPNRKLSYSWTYKDYEGYSVVTFELEEQHGLTLLRLTHEGLGSFPALPDFAPESFAAGWTYLVGTSLRDFLEQ